MPVIDDIKGAAARLLAQTEELYDEDASLQDRMIQNYSCHVADMTLDIFRVDESGEDERHSLESLEKLSSQ